MILWNHKNNHPNNMLGGKAMVNILPGPVIAELTSTKTDGASRHDMPTGGSETTARLYFKMDLSDSSPRLSHPEFAGQPCIRNHWNAATQREKTTKPGQCHVPQWGRFDSRIWWISRFRLQGIPESAELHNSNRRICWENVAKKRQIHPFLMVNHDFDFQHFFSPKSIH